ncbi:ATP-binding protein [Streptomyces beihaiensis]|uniref:histidine kinase n=1 Tax=Streptomyces beihaiensis TaxID=2984495 RepID=A0ABT3U474_9ACTN|nr:ATP-binding protein [Streptomyces beihaiensis]MCX3064079.1 ATP-binding protein [Streptomyces beihaiensis]
MALALRNKALGARRGEAEAALGNRLSYAEAELGRVRGELARVLGEQEAAIREAEQGAEESTKAVLKGAARFLQSLAAEQTALLDEVQRKYGGHGVLADLMDVNHANAQMARKAQGIAVMCGAPLGRRNQPASVYDVVRSAQSQIRNFQRVEIMQPSGIALKASAVAPVALAVAELLDNAASFSQADAPIEVTFQRVQKNLCIVIDDAGVSMSDEDRQKATALLSGDSVPQLSQLGTQPKFGFPVVGLIARQYGFKVDVTGVSRYGGVRAVVLLPEELWTMEETPPPATEATAPATTAAPVSGIRPVPERDQGGARTVHGLPKRGARKSPVVGVSSWQSAPGGTASVPGEGRSTPGDGRGAPGGEPQPQPHQQPQQQPQPARASRGSGGGLGAFQRGTRTGRDLDAPTLEGSEET